MSDIDIIWQNTAALGDRSDGGHRLIMISYGQNGEFRQFYLDWERGDAEAHFRAYMDNRTEIERRLEGNVANAVEIPFSAEGTAWIGSASQLADVSQELFAQLMLGEDDRL